MLEIFRRLFVRATDRSCCGKLLVPFDLAAATESFTGSLLCCTSCGIVYSDWVLVDDSGKVTPDPILAVSGKRGARVATVGYNDLGHVTIREGAAPRNAEYHIVLGMRFHSDLGVAFLRQVVYCLLCARNLKIRGSITQRVSIGIDGYTQDQREVWEIPETVEFFTKVALVAPGLSLWFTDAFRPVYYQVLAAGADYQTMHLVQAILDVTFKDREAPRVPADLPTKARFFPLVQHPAVTGLVNAEKWLADLLGEGSDRIAPLVADEHRRIQTTLASYQQAWKRAGHRRTTAEHCVGRTPKIGSDSSIGGAHAPNNRAASKHLWGRNADWYGASDSI